jgi:glycosyltransferase involved in cell wall biosynthesis
MKVLHLCTSDADGGAARGSLWLHEALRRRGVNSLMMVARKSSDDPTILPLPRMSDRLSARIRGVLDDLPLRRYRKTEDSFWSVGWIPGQIGRVIEEVDPDLVHLHWLGAGFLPISALPQIRRPLVWTQRDMWGFTGGCHYTAGCTRYVDQCGACPQLRSEREDDLSRAIFLRKQQHWRGLDLTLVPISSWMGERVRESALFRNSPVEVIPNGLDTRLFQPAPQAEARRAWDLPADRRIMLYGALNATRDRRKGFPELLAAVRRFAATESARDTLLVVFGDDEPEDRPDFGIETRYVGMVRDDARLAQLYSAADLYVMPSLQEAFGKTLIESMACGTPVVAFRSGGSVDIIGHEDDGYLARPFVPDDLALGMEWCLERLRGDDALRRRARAKVEARFDIDIVAGQYCDLYGRVLDKARRGAVNARPQDRYRAGNDVGWQAARMSDGPAEPARPGAGYDHWGQGAESGA